jgi:pyruvate dehydrogenase E1 component beta subunit
VEEHAVAGVVQRAFDALVAPPRRLTGPDHALPAAPHLEAAFIPSVQGIAAAVRQVMGLAPATVT